MNAPKYHRILRAAGVKYFIVGEYLIVEAEGSYLNITNWTEDQFYEFLGY